MKHSTPVEHTVIPTSDRYVIEDELVQDFVASLKRGAGRLQCRSIGLEFIHQSGRTDVIGVTSKGHLIAFEGKLQQWKRALDQARRNTAFAHYSYVVLPGHSATPALRNRDQFRKLGVGLVVMRQGQPKVSIRARRHDPLLPWVTDNAKRSIR